MLDKEAVQNNNKYTYTY